MKDDYNFSMYSQTIHIPSPEILKPWKYTLSSPLSIQLIWCTQPPSWACYPKEKSVAYHTGAVIGRYSKSHLALTCSFVHCFLDRPAISVLYFFLSLEGRKQNFHCPWVEKYQWWCTCTIFFSSFFLFFSKDVHCLKS